MEELTMVEHAPWIGRNYKTGINGQRVAVVGYSHYLCKGVTDQEELTHDTLTRVIRKDDLVLFKKIRGYFNFSGNEDFWNSVLFFNFVPESIGTTDNRYDYGTEQQHERGRARATSLMEQYTPHKLFVFTKKGWSEFPAPREQDPEGDCLSLGAEFPGFSWGTYSFDGHIVMAFGLRHPQFAVTDEMTRAVRHILAMPCLTT